MSENLFSKIAARLADENAVFIRHPDGETLSYGRAFARTAQFANVLIRLGVEPGDRVAAQVEKSADALLLYLGCLRAGAVFLPLNTGYTGPELAYFLGDAEPRVVVVDPVSEAAAETIRREAGVAHLATLGPDGAGSLAAAANAADERFADVARTADDLAAILYTSGTTGRSKGAMLTHGNLASNAEALATYWRFTKDDVLLHALPIFHTHGLFVATNVILLSGASMILLPAFDLDEIIRLLPQATTMMGVPTFYTRLLTRPDFNRDLIAHMRLFVSGSAPLSAETHKEFEARTGHAILERYGMTETNMNTSNPYEGARRAGTVGFPLPGVEIRIADSDSGAALGPGEVGMIEVRGPNVFKGYWRMPEKTAAEFREDGFFITGDLGLIDAQGYLNIVGREKDLIISGGYNVYPAEVENALNALDGVADSAVIGAPHPDFGEAVTAVVVCRRGAQPNEQEIRAALATGLAKYKVPKRVLFVDELPRNKMGKTEKKALRERYRDLFAGR
ncbi:MAG TPA: malonyl-CoA synthase [Kiloniellales bacterium]